MNPPRVLAVCADDFGLDAANDDVILRLAEQGRVTAASCLVTGPAWPGAAARVERLARAARCGLHFNLTEGRPLSAALARHWPVFPSLPHLMARAHAGLLPRDAIAQEWRAQLDAYARVAGQAPAFVDGHQHVHALPGVRGPVVETAAARGWPVRSTACLPGPGSPVKRRLIEASGGRALGRLLDEHRVPHNGVLLGAYDFRATDYRRLMQSWLAAMPATGALLFCHPGRAGPGDPIGEAREREAAYLGGPDFPRDLQAAGVRLAAPPWQTTIGD